MSTILYPAPVTGELEYETVTRALREIEYCHLAQIRPDPAINEWTYRLVIHRYGSRDIWLQEVSQVIARKFIALDSVGCFASGKGSGGATMSYWGCRDTRRVQNPALVAALKDRDEWKKNWFDLVERTAREIGRLKSAAEDVYEFEFEHDRSPYVRRLRRVLKALGSTLYRTDGVDPE